jgi:hypothetical protein
MPLICPSFMVAPHMPFAGVGGFTGALAGLAAIPSPREKTHQRASRAPRRLI